MSAITHKKRDGVRKYQPTFRSDITFQYINKIREVFPTKKKLTNVLLGNQSKPMIR